MNAPGNHNHPNRDRLTDYDAYLANVRCDPGPSGEARKKIPPARVEQAGFPEFSTSAFRHQRLTTGSRPGGCGPGRRERGAAGRNRPEARVDNTPPLPVGVLERSKPERADNRAWVPGRNTEAGTGSRVAVPEHSTVAGSKVAGSNPGDVRGRDQTTGRRPDWATSSKGQPKKRRRADSSSGSPGTSWG